MSSSSESRARKARHTAGRIPLLPLNPRRRHIIRHLQHQRLRRLLLRRSELDSKSLPSNRVGRTGKNERGGDSARDGALEGEVVGVDAVEGAEVREDGGSDSGCSSWSAWFELFKRRRRSVRPSAVRKGPENSRIDVVGAAQLGQRVHADMRMHVENTRDEPSTMSLDNLRSLRRREVLADLYDETAVEDDVV
jgi:hypothetical protein